MNLSALFIHRPIGTSLLTLGIALVGMVAFLLLPVSPLPQIDFPTISVSASLPGASPDTMATTVSTPLERSLGRIAGITEMTSSSTLGNTSITIQFDLDRDINGAARDVQAAINAARALLPTNLPSNPTYRKVNPADSPIMILALTSDSMTRPQMYDAASTILAQKLSQLPGVGTVIVGGSSLPAVRVELVPQRLNEEGVSLETVRTVIGAFNANKPKGQVEKNDQRWQIGTNDQAMHASDYLPLIVSYNAKTGAPVRLRDIGLVLDSEENVRNSGSFNGKPSVLMIILRQPGANIIQTVDNISNMMPSLRASIPASIDLQVAMDRTPTIRASLRDVERTLLIAIALVVMVVFLFLRRPRATLIPAVAVPISLIGTFAVMYLCNYSLDNLSLMALTIATGFVVDDAVVVLENIMRHIERGLSPFEAALLGAREVGFTVLSMSLSLIAVFIPILMMGGIIGRMFREFAVTLSVAILVSLAVSLTTTPMMCAHLLKRQNEEKHPGRISLRIKSWFDAMSGGYERSLAWALDHRRIMLVLLFITIAVNISLYIIIPKGFFPQQDTGRLTGSIQADQDISFQAMNQKLNDFISIVRKDPAVEGVFGFTGGGQLNTGFVYVALKSISERSSIDSVIARLRKNTADVPGAKLYFAPMQDIRIGGRQSNALYQFTLQSDSLAALRQWEPKVREALLNTPGLLDVNSDQQDKGLQTTLTVDRDTALRLGISMAAIDNTLNDAFGQRQVSTMYAPLNQYHVVMEVAPPYWQSPDSLKDIYVIGANNAQIPLSAFSIFTPTFTPLAVNHQSQFAAATISFNLPQNESLGTATQIIHQTMASLGVPSSIQGSFQGTARAFQDSLSSQPWLILTALLAVYLVLGILYESYVHPLTILSTLPSAGVGALLALMLCNTEFSVIALIGVILLIGIVKKNAIMMIDFALVAEREQNMTPRDAIFHACVQRFRPIMMTTMAALFGALPLALGSGDGAELRQPLGIAIVGGLIFSQLLTLYTTPVVYLYLDRLSKRKPVVSEVSA
jgi:multidrug efflux pump